MRARAAKLPHPPRVLVIVANETAATKSYLALKQKRAVDAGCVLKMQQFATSVSTEELQAAILKSDTNSIIVQLPLPLGIDTKAVCDAIPAEKDADVLSSAAREKFENGDTDALLPPVVDAVRKIFARNNVGTKGKRAVVIGDGWLVGNPCAKWLAQQGAIIEVIANPSEFAGARVALAQADIIVAGAGVPHFIKPEMLKEGVVLIDAGTSESGGTIVGDADPSCANKCSLFTPVPGGVGPLAVAKLFENAVTLAERTMNI